jgi:thioredoxin 1
MTINLNESNFESTVKSADNQGKVLLVDFWAPWCGPCNALTPILNELSDEEFKVYKVNVEEEASLADEFNVSSIPALVFFKNGMISKRVMGLKNKEEILQIFKELE